jgi:uncharacterized protein YdhG (YjbR/CyaY superfamily)
LRSQVTPSLHVTSLGKIMRAIQKPPRDIDEYIGGFPTAVRAILKKIRTTIKKAAPGAEETIKYGMPTFTLEGNLVYFAAFKQHVGFFPPVKGDAALKKELSLYEGPKGNLKFPLDQPIPYALIGRIVNLRIKENRRRAEARKKRR